MLLGVELVMSLSGCLCIEVEVVLDEFDELFDGLFVVVIVGGDDDFFVWVDIE